jgi:predicted  nucleic acid-binding Zn-ribbon protein
LKAAIADLDSLRTQLADERKKLVGGKELWRRRHSALRKRFNTLEAEMDTLKGQLEDLQHIEQSLDLRRELVPEPAPRTTEPKQ